MKQKADAYYFGNSMKGVFVPGDLLELCEISFEQLQCGDIVAVQSAEKSCYVHRIIRIENSTAVTQGDNNPRPDQRPLTAGDIFQKVTGRRDHPGNRYPVTAGAEGMAEFQHHQRYWRNAPLRRIVGKWCFWRRALFPEMVFDGVWEWRWRNHLIARKSRSSGTIYCKNWYRIFFRLEQKKTDPQDLQV